MPNKTRPALLWLLIGLIAMSGCSALTEREAMQSAPTPITSPKDERNYRSLLLDNGLKVLLVQDAKADKAAASMNVAAGSFHEPDEWPGLAHFLEHMLFLGTETFPEPDAYQNFIRQHGGSYNAFTAPRDTNYFFDIRPEHLDGALARFSRFFVDPLFNEDYLTREVNAVNSEWSATLQDDGRRRLDALRQALNPEHPASRFTAGNRDTLDVKDEQLVEAMRQYHQDFYHPDRMTLVIYGPQELDELEQLTQAHFLDLQHQESQAEPEWPSLLVKEQLPAQLNIKPLRQTRQLQLLFALPDSLADYDKKPDSYLAHLIGHEGEGSLFYALKNKGWVTGLSAGSQMRTGQEALFSINLELTAEGDQQIDQIQAAVFAWLDLIREEGIQAWRFEEKALIAETQFRFMERSEPSNLATHLAMQMARYPIEDLLRAHYAWDHFDADLITHYLDQLQPEKRLLLHISPDVETDQTSPWVPAEYQLKQPLPEQERHLKTPSELDLQLPSENAFLPTHLELLDGDRQEQPELIKDTKGIQAWHGLDTSFNVPRSQIYISLQNPKVATDLRHRLMAQLTARWLEDQLSAAAYPARLAGLHHDVYAHSRGITLALGGFNAEQPRLANKALDELLAAEINKDQFHRIYNRLEESLINQGRDRLPQQMVRQLFTHTIEPSFTAEQQLKALKSIQYDDLVHFVPSFTSHLHIQLLAWGNTSRAEAEALSLDLQKRLNPQLESDDLDLLQVRQLPNGQWNQALELDHNDRGLLFYIQGQDTSLAEEAKLRLLNQLQSAAFFHELRTQQQLGYAVFSHYLPLMQQPGVFYFIQSPDTEPDALAEATEAFLRSDLKRLEAMPADDFAEHQQSLITRLTQQDKRLSQRAEGFWREIGSQRQDFQHRDKLADAVKALSQQDLIDFYIEAINFERGLLLLGTSPETQSRLLPGQAAQPEDWPTH